MSRISEMDNKLAVTLFHHTGDGACRLNSCDGSILSANQALVHLLGAESVNQLTGHSISEFVDEGWDIVRRRITKSQKITDLEVKLTLNDRSVRHVLCNAYKADHGQVDLILKDLTSVHETEASRRLLVTAIEQAAETIVVTDTRGVIQYVNPAYEKITGFKKEEVLGKNPNVVKSGKQDKSFYNDLWATIERGEVWKGHFVNRKKDGTLYHEDAAISPVRDQHNTIVAFVEVKRDVTEQVKLNQQLQESEERFRMLIESSPDLIWETNAAFEFTYVSPQIRTLLNYSPVAALGRTMFDFMPPSEARKKRLEISEFIKGKKPFFEIEARCRAGSRGQTVVIEMSGVPIVDKDGDLTGYRGVNRDVTERKKAEDELKHYQQHLESLVAERVIELQSVNSRMKQEIAEREKAEETLREALTALERTNQELAQFAHVSSHDLQEPLRAVKSFARLLERRYEGKLDRDADEFIRYISEGATRAYTLINDLLEYTRSGAETTTSKINVETLCREIVQDFQPRLDDENGRISWHCDTRVTANRNQLRVVLSSLIDNGLKFRHPERPPVIHIGVEEQPDHWTVSVSDNGIGVEPRHQERIFQIFQQLRKHEGSGSGIGLAISKKIVENWGGKIWVQSDAGQGSVFSFTLPR